MGAALTVRISAFVSATVAEGPGRRACIWVQGCTIRCPGCFNQHMWRAGGGRAVPAAELAAMALASPGVEGITFLGGEPFDQAVPLAEVARRAQEGGLSVMTFTGYDYDELKSGRRPGAHALLAHTDLLVDGPYLRDQPDLVRPWVGSTNQRLLSLSGRYDSVVGRLESIPDRVEVRLHRDGSVFVNGMHDAQELRSYLHSVDLRRKRPAVRRARRS